MAELSKTYSNNEITIVWKPSACIHSTLCWKGAAGLRAVFNPMEKPWIKPYGADTEAIIARVKACPSGALSFYYKDAPEQPESAVAAAPVVEILPDGPLLVHGPVHVKHQDRTAALSKPVTAFCRCGASANKPYCDGSHAQSGFKG